jgi:hypothetical protein
MEMRMIELKSFKEVQVPEGYRHFSVAEIYKMLRLGSAEHVAIFIRNNSSQPTQDLYKLDLLLEVADVYHENIKNGEHFWTLFNKHATVSPDGRGKPAVPRLETRAKNFTKALFRFIVQGFPLSTRKQAMEKLAICETNECGFFDGSICRHTKCGCFTRIKTFFESEHCPIGKW